MDALELKRLVKQIRGVSYKPEDLHDSLDDSSVILLRANNIYDSRIVFDDVIFVDRKKVSHEQLLKKGDILICASSGSKNLVGKAATVDFDTEVTFGAFCKVVRPINPRDAEYLSMYFQSPRYRREIASVAIGININNIRNEHIDSLYVHWPTEEKRQKIVAVLKKLDCAIRLRKCQLENLDNLIKARFVEMFGNHFDTRNTIDWPIKTIGNLAVSISDGSNVDKALYKDSGDVLFLRIQNVWCNEFRLDDSVYISEAENKAYKDTSLKHGDLLITKIGRYYTEDSSLGRVSVYLGEDDKANFSNNIMRIRFGEEINSEFVNALMNLDDYNKYIRRTSVGGTDKRALSKGLIANYPILVPPIDKQNEFVGFIHQIDKSKFTIQQSLNETQKLFDSLMQQYFG